MDAKEIKYQRLCEECRRFRKVAEADEKDWLLDALEYKELISQ